jgi:excisionase family DNA binding protein
MVNTQSPDSVYLTRQEASTYLRLSLRGFDELLSRGAIPTHRLGRRLLFSRSALDRYVQEHRADKAGEFYTGQEFMEQYQPEEITHGYTWGRWTYDARTLVLHHPYYEVDLERCIDVHSILDWILQVAGKTWATSSDIGDLVRALAELAGYGLQGAVCPFGRVGKGISYKALLQGQEAAEQGGHTTRVAQTAVEVG